MLRYKQQVVVILALSATCVFAIRVDTGKPSSKPQFSSSGSSEPVRGKEKFNPGLTQNGGWHKPESAVMYGDNAWQEADLSVFGTSKDEVSRHSDGHGVNFNDGSTSVKVGQIASFSSENGQQFNGFSGGSLNSGGDLVVGQGSVQRPANAGSQYQSFAGFSHGDSPSFPVHAKIGPETSQYSQVVSANPKTPVSSATDFSKRQQVLSSDVRPTQVKPQGQSQFYGNKPSFQTSQTFGHKINPPQYPSKPASTRPQPVYHQKVSSKPVQPPYKPDIQYVPTGGRFPPQKPSHFSSIRGGKLPPNKYPIQPSQQFPKAHPQLQISRGGFSLGTF